MRGLALAWVVLAILAGAAQAAERLTTLLSTNRVEIHSTYDGAEIVLFGAIEGEVRGIEPVAVRVVGPRGSITIREKAPFGPIFFNQHSARIPEVPQFHLLQTSRELGEMQVIASFDAARLSPLSGLEQKPGKSRFVDALMRLKEEQGLYKIEPTAVRFATPRLFQARIALPANAPLGRYFVETSLFDDNAVVTSQNEFFMVKSGFEARTALEARDRPWLYGFSAMLLALALGWLASVAFRRD